MLNINITLETNIELGTDAYYVAPDFIVKKVILAGAGSFIEKDKPNESIVIVDIETTEGKVERGALPIEDLFHTIEEAEAEILTRKAKADESKTEDLKQLYIRIIERQLEVEQQLTNMGINYEELKPQLDNK